MNGVSFTVNGKKTVFYKDDILYTPARNILVSGMLMFLCFFLSIPMGIIFGLNLLFSFFSHGFIGAFYLTHIMVMGTILFVLAIFGAIALTSMKINSNIMIDMVKRVNHSKVIFNTETNRVNIKE